MDLAPIAVTGIGCRFPGGADSVAAFWQLLMDGVDAIGDVPDDRWRHQRFYHPEKNKDERTPQRQGGFVRNLDAFDPAFFGISPREAHSMDPQQRLLLEVAWEALEDAGYPLEAIAGTRMGVFTGASQRDYGDLQDLDSLTTHSVTGWAMAMLSNRLSYAFDLQGPSFTIDTACSSALVALHQACHSIGRGECDTALVCAVNALLHPLHHVAFSRLSMLSPTSRCHAFDASADGYVRSEGAGVVVLKPLDRAVADGDRIYATILRTIVNSDGRNEGLTVPSTEGQVRLLRAAYRNLPVERVHYVEAHGTGTQVGDPVEARALGEVLRHPSRPLTVGSVKTNIGHLEAAAGIAGLIKACLIAWHGVVPANLHHHEPNPAIPFGALGIEIPSASRTGFPADFLLGVNSFGFGGTNGHAVLTTPPPTSAVAPAVAKLPQLVCLSARSAEGLEALRQRYLELPDATLAQVACASLKRRSQHPYRLACVAEHMADLATAEPHRPERMRPRLGFVYSGQGSQWVGLGRTLLQEPIFAGFIADCESYYRTIAGWSLREAIEQDSTSMDRTSIVQPILFAVQAGLTLLLRAWGIEPEVVIGHSVGEVAAAWAAGILTLADAIHLVVHRGRVMDCDSSRGRMLAVSSTPAAVTAYLTDGVCLAAVNGPQSLTLSGSAAGIDIVRRRLQDAGLECTDVRVEYAFHSAQLDSLQPELTSALQGLQPLPGLVPFISTVTGQPTEALTADYWWQNVRSPVRFADAMQTALQRGITLFVEIGGHPVLGAAIVDNGGRAVATLRRQQPERRAWLETLAVLYRSGLTLRWGEAEPGGWITLPGYPWQQQSYWHESRRTRTLKLHPGHYAMLGLEGDRQRWSQALSPEDPAWLADHQFHHQLILSASSMLEMALEAAHAIHGDLPLVLEGVHLESACFIAPGTVLQTSVTASGEFRIQANEPHRTVAHGRIQRDAGVRPSPIDIDSLGQSLPHPWEGSLRDAWAARGLQFGPAFDRIRRGRFGPGEAVAEVEGDPTLSEWDGLSFTHPGTIDSCLQVLLQAVDPALMGEGTTFLPVSIRRVRLLQPMERSVIVHARTMRQSPRELEVNLSVYNPQGQLLWDASGYRMVRALDSSRPDMLDPLCYRMEWIPSPLGERQERDGLWLVFSDGGPLALDVLGRMAAAGLTTRVLLPGDQYDLRDIGTVEGCLHLQSLSAALTDPAAPLMPLIDLLQQADAHNLPIPRLWAVTRRTQPVGDVAVQPEGAPLWGLVRVLGTEEPWLFPTLIDIEDEATDGAAVFDELFSHHPEEVAVRGGQRHVSRCERLALSQQPPLALPPAAGQPYVLGTDRPGTLEALEWKIPPARPLAADEVRIGVAAAGLNFSDVMRALGIYPTEGPLGIEMAGRVVELGQGVTDLRVGDRVMGLAPGAFASQVVARRALVVPTPSGWSDAQAAGVPLSYATAAHALLTIGRLRAGERVLIHTATGGLGQAAIQVARRVGAEIFATAGSTEKRDLLRQQGIQYIFDSRTTAFAEEIMTVTHGEGIDVVLNTLAGDAIPKGLSTLRRFGRFVDVTKRDIYTDMPLGLNPFTRGLSYSAVDMEQVMQHDAPSVQTLLQGIQEPLPVQSFGYRNAVDAFRTMSQAKHSGKIVLTVEPPAAVLRSTAVSADGTYVVVGGLGGFGREVVAWLLQQGAGRVAVLTRTPGAHLPIDDARVQAFAVDVGDAAAVTGVCSELAPIRGVIHAAMQLDDTPTLKLTRERLEVVFRSKIQGAWNLHQATLTQPLDFFVLFSSNAAWFGAAGQGNYSAANAFLDSLAHYRRALGLPSLTVNWGPLSGVGYLARNPQVAAWLQAGGVRSITVSQALAGLRRALDVNVPQVGVMDMDWPRWHQATRNRGVARFESLRTASAEEQAPDVLGLGGDEQRASIHGLLMAQVARVLGLAADRIDARRPLSDMGLDSLMSLQLRNWAKSTLQVTLTASTLLGGPSVEELVDLLATALRKPVEAEVLMAVEDTLDDAQVEEMLSALLMDDRA